MIRPNIDLDSADRDRVEEYAEEYGLRMPRAYAELIRAGLAADQEEQER